MRPGLGFLLATGFWGARALWYATHGEPGIAVFEGVLALMAAAGVVVMLLRGRRPTKPIEEER